MRELETLKKWIDESRNIVFFGGAGVSTESGIPDFRGQGGLYGRKYAYPPEEMLSVGFFLRNPEAFYQFYREEVLCLAAEPNAAHRKLAEWEREGKLKAVVTQNIDGLHQKAGSKRVYELHGSVYKNRCTRCQRAFGVEAVAEVEGVPRCQCGGVIRPEVVLYGENLDTDVLRGAAAAIASADLLIVGGTSLVVYPAAGLLDYYGGNRLALVNRTGTGRDDLANLAVRAPIGEVFSRL
ncbi:MAG: NAD-dependent protein deacylase [Clostridiales bacterium]|nr:NAD-dependent protein deacylase [Clostridiales bacterium]